MKFFENYQSKDATELNGTVVSYLIGVTTSARSKMIEKKRIES
jgi:hypothetical protein